MYTRGDFPFPCLDDHNHNGICLSSIHDMMPAVVSPQHGPRNGPGMVTLDELLRVCREKGLEDTDVLTALRAQAVTLNDLRSLADLPPSEIATVLGVPAVKVGRSRRDIYHHLLHSS